MKPFYALLGLVVVVGGGWLVWASRTTPAPAPAASRLVPAAADGFRGYTLGSEAAPVEVDEYAACVASQRYAGRIEASYQEGIALGVQGTPTFFVNGRLKTDNNASSDRFKQVVDSVIAAQHKR